MIMSKIMIKEMSVKQIKEYINKNNVLDKEIIDDMSEDNRKGVKDLLYSYNKKLIYIQNEKERIHKLLKYEKILNKKKFKFVAGLDEAGRGPLAGPVFAGAVIFPENCEIIGVRDSKKLNKKRREELFLEIKKKALSWGVGYSTAAMIDKYNILEATKIAMVQALYSMKIKPDYLLVDALNISLISLPQDFMIKGEDKSLSIAAASIIAKVSRDKYIEKIAKKYPEYLFEKHKGYPTKEHYELLRQYGPCPEHRLSFAGVKN
jgi:ribonuclease HII